MSFLDRNADKPARVFSRGVNCLWFPPDPAADAVSPPTILFLHGIGERGDGGAELKHVCRLGLPKFRSGAQPLTETPFPFLVIAPQCPPQRLWCDDDVLAAIDRLLADVIDQGLVDSDRLTVAGFSMGGIASFCLALRHPGRFAAMVSVCGRCPLPDTLPALAGLPAWIAYAEDDEIAELTAGSRLAIDVLAPLGSVVARGYRPGAVDGVPAHARTADLAFAEPGLYLWLSRQRRGGHPTT